MIRAVVIWLVLASAALAQAEDDAAAPRVEVALDPEAAVTVGTPVRVAVTVAVPTFMPQPPRWPDLQIADAITRLPERATQPVTLRVGGESWSGLTRTYEIIPQRAADFSFADEAVEVTWSDPATGEAVLTAAPVPDFTVPAVVPPGAEGLDPFVAAQTLSLDMTVDGLPETPKPGDAFTLTLTTTATGTSAMLLPPLADRLGAQAGLRAYPRQPALQDAPGVRGAPATATRQDAVDYVIEAPGSFRLEGIRLDWWDVAGGTVEAAETQPVAFEVAAPPGWGETDAAAREGGRWGLWLGAVAVVVAVAAGLGLRRRRRGAGTQAPSERARFRALQRAVSGGPVGAIRPEIARWLGAGPGEDLPDAVARPLLALERQAYGAGGGGGDAAAERDELRAGLAGWRRDLRTRGGRAAAAGLPPLNPAYSAGAGTGARGAGAVSGREISV